MPGVLVPLRSRSGAQRIASPPNASVSSRYTMSATSAPSANLPPQSNGPLVVDLDGSLCRTDTLWESFFVAWRRHWLLPLQVIVWLLSGRQQLKHRLAQLALPDTRSLPWNPLVVEMLRNARLSGRRTVLATAAATPVAQACASELGLFDDVLASTGDVNLKGKAKADALVERFGIGGFDYVGDSRADLPVWQVAAGKYSVSSIVPSGGSRLQPDEGPVRGHWLKLLRVRHWVKNVLVFVAPIAAHSWSSGQGWQNVGLTFAAFCMVCSGVYVFNDLFDLASDRTHPTKRRRPLAAGEISLPAALVAGIALISAGLATAWFAGCAVLICLLAYLLVNAAYTAYIKRVAVFDVFFLAGLYTLRIVAGALAMAVPLSTWLGAFSVFAFLSLALLKRAADLARLAPDESLAGRGYSGRDAGFVNGFGVGAAIASCLVLALYVASEQVTALYSRPLWLWGVAVVVLLWLARVWRMAMNGTMDDDPVLFATRDGVSWGCVLATGVCVLLAI